MTTISSKNTHTQAVSVSARALECAPQNNIIRLAELAQEARIPNNVASFPNRGYFYVLIVYHVLLGFHLVFLAVYSWFPAYLHREGVIYGLVLKFVGNFAYVRP